MALDGIILSKEKEDLCRRLPIRINRITQVSDNELVFNVHANKERTNLIISCHSVYNRIHLTDKAYKGYDNPSGFVMLLRKTILNGIIEEIRQYDYDRYLDLSIRSLNDLYDEVHYHLYVELMGKYANVVLVDANGKILDAFKRIPPFENNKRTIWPGSKYVLPQNQHKKDPFKSDDYDENISLVKQFQGFSPLLEKEVHYRLNEEDFKGIMQKIKTSDKLYIALDKKDYVYHIIPLKHTSLNFKAYDLNEGFDKLYYSLEEKERIKHLTDDLFKYTKRQLKHYEDKVVKLKETLKEAENCDELRNFGDLLFMYHDLDAKGMSEVSVEDFDGQEKKIRLDPKYTIKENANRYYHNYHKKRKSKEHLLEQIAIATNELDYFRSVNEQLSIANYEDALEIKEEMIRYGNLKDNRKNKRKNKTSKWHLYQISFKDHLITFGKNNLQNDILTFKYGKSDYTWLHAQKLHGAHVLIDTAKPDEETLRFAANIAAYFSNGRYSSSVGVDYCLLKDVKKIKGSKAGFVAIKNYKTIFIDPYLEDDSIIMTI